MIDVLVPLLAMALPLGLVAVVFLIIIRVNKGRREKLLRIGSSLGFTYIDPLGEIPPGAGLSSSPATNQHGFFRKAFALIQPQWKLKGRFGSRSVRIKSVVKGSGKNKSVYTNILAPFDKGLNLGLSVYSENFFSKIGKNVFQTQDIQIGDPELDELVMIKGRSESEVKSFFLGTGVRQAIVSMFRADKGFQVNDEGVVFERMGIIVDEDEYRKLLGLATEAASAMDPL